MDGFLEELYNNHKNGIFSFLVGMVRDIHVAEDLLQETFARALAAAPRFKEVAAPRTWVMTIARNLAINHLRARRPHGESPEVAGLSHPASEPPDAAQLHEASGNVAAAIGALDTIHREVFLLKVIEGLTYRQIAAIIDVPVGTAQSRFHHAVRKLRAQLSQKGTTP